MEVDLLFGGQHILIRCCAHILNIIVQDGIENINSSPSLIQAFNELAERVGLPSKAGLLLDIPNR
jgi:hypothetical protein